MVDSLYFLHIPKTAGTSLTRFLDGQFPPEAIFPYQLWSDYVASPYFDQAEAARPYYRLYRGHFGMGLAADAGKSPAVVTFLREPRQHLLSMFNHMAIDRENGTEAHPGLLPDCHSLSEYLADEDNRRRLTNVQARYLCSRLSSSTVADRDLAEGSFFTAVAAGPSPLEPLEHALPGALDAIDFVGVQEFYAESLVLMSAQLGLDAPTPEQLDSRSMHLTRPAERQQLSDAAESWVSSITTVDRQLHQRSLARVAAQYDQLVVRLTGQASPGLVTATPEQRAATLERTLSAMQSVAQPMPPSAVRPVGAESVEAESEEAGSVGPVSEEAESVVGERFVNLSPSQSLTMRAGEEARIQFECTNKSNRVFFGYTRLAPTSVAPMLLATDDPVNRTSEFHHDTWFSANRPCAEFVVDKARPGRPDAFAEHDSCRFSFLIRAPERPGIYVERFAPVIEGVEALSAEVSFELVIEVTAA